MSSAWDNQAERYRHGARHTDRHRAMASKQNERRLTTILASDVVGYSHLMAANEEQTLKRFREYREIFLQFTEKHGGRVFNTAGDAILAEFGSAVEAVRCAVSIQEDLAVHNAELGEDEQMWFRIGVNVGDVMIEGSDLFGDGVNVAARLEGLAERGGICISGSTFEQVKNKLSLGFADMGPQKVKNIPEPIPAFQIVPGTVSVAPESSAVRQGFRISPAMSIGVVILAALVVGGLTWVIVRNGAASAFPHDGSWRVQVHSRSGCLENRNTAYKIDVRDGEIDESNQPRPKTGTVDADGNFSIQVSDPTGRPLSRHIGTIKGTAGEGEFIGAKPNCIGKVRLTRLSE